MAVSNEDINFDLHDNRAFVADEENEEDTTPKTSTETTAESSFQTSDLKRKLTSSSKTQDELRTIITVCIFFGVSVAIALILTIYLGPPQVQPHGAVSSKTSSCCGVGSQVLKSGGSVIDSSVATILCESAYDARVLFGCGVIIYHNQRKNSSYTLDFSCSSSHHMNRGHTVEFPTLLRGLARIHKKLGALKWKDILQPVLNLFQSDTALDVSKQTFTLETKNLFTEIAAKGVNYFYSDFLPKMSNQTGIDSAQLKDFKSYEPTSRDPYRMIFKGYFLEAVPGCSSSSLLMLLSILENLTASGRVTWNSTDFYHYFVEAAKVTEVYLQNFTKLELSGNQWLDQVKYLSSLIMDDSTLDVVPLAGTDMEDHTTFMVSAIGPSDDLVSMAVWYSNEPDVNPYKLPNNLAMSRCMSTSVDDGSSGGYAEDVVSVVVHNVVKPCALRLAITGSTYLDVAQVLINHFGLNKNISEATCSPRIYIAGDKILYQDNFPQDVVDMLRARKNSSSIKILPVNFTSNFVTIVWKDKEDVESCADDGRASFSIF